MQIDKGVGVLKPNPKSKCVWDINLFKCAMYFVKQYDLIKMEQNKNNDFVVQ